MDPLPQLVGALNAYQPAFLASYPTVLALLADERAAGRLAIDPVSLWSGGECLPAAVRARIERAFGCGVVDEYGASECLSIAYGCAAGWLHVNADWVLLEPVDDDRRPTPPGEASRTALLTNLANRVQPVIRYDLGDSVVARPDPCPCGSPLPAIRVEGRHDDVVSLIAPNGRTVRLLPLALTTVVEEATAVRRFQIVQTASDRLMLRLEPGAGGDRDALWTAAAGALRRYLAQQSLPNVGVGLDPGGPVTDRLSGKLREVVVEMRQAPARCASGESDAIAPAGRRRRHGEADAVQHLVRDRRDHGRAAAPGAVDDGAGSRTDPVQRVPAGARRRPRQGNRDRK
jgi:hypothetical protein